MKEKIVLIGAGSAVFTRGLVADFILRKREMHLALVDIDAGALAVAEGLSRKMIDFKKAPIKLTASVNRRDALKGATVVICTIGLGGRRAWEQDVFVPRKFGIYQPVGDSVMPGGTSRALRMIPAMADIAKDVLDLAPGALFFNYGNPMCPVCRGVRKATGAEIIGLCHGVFAAGRYLAGALGAESSRIKYNAVGMNHLTWFLEMSVDGKNAMPELRRIADEKLSAFMPSGKSGKRTSKAKAHGRGTEEQDDPNPFSWQLLKLFGAFPAPMDRHVMEFFPRIFSGRGAYYGRTPGVDAYSFEETIAEGDETFERMRADALSRKPLDEGYFERISGEHEQVTDIIDSIRSDAGRVYSANLPNNGRVSNLPDDAVIELPAAACASGMKPLSQRPLPAGIAGTLIPRLSWVETVVEAALEGRRDKFIQALILDGAVSSVEDAGKLADELLKAHAKFLPRFKRGDRK